MILAETVYVLEPLYQLERTRVAELARAVLAFGPVRVVGAGLLLRAIEVYELDRLDFAEAYLVAGAERSGVGVARSFDRSIDKVRTVARIEPSRTVAWSGSSPPPG
ncbi:MAG: hypothetical protein ACRDZQ_13020 [Acidimicrobiales bacterium]